MFYQTFAIFVDIPWLAVIPTLVFYGLYQRWPFKLVLAASLLWLVYLFYELSVYYGIVCSEECNIRVDLLLIYPFLAGLSLLALLQILWSVFGQKQD